MIKNNTTFLEIDSKALLHNFNYFNSLTHSNVKKGVVVKANGYGSDANYIASVLHDKVDYFIVAFTHEAQALKKSGVIKPVLVLLPQLADIDILFEHQLEVGVYCFEILDAIDKRSKELNQEIGVHIKFNTGLNRLGFRVEDIEELSEKLLNYNLLRVIALYSHFAASEDKKERDFSKRQIKDFICWTGILKNKIKQNPFLHMSNTSSVINFPEAHFNMIRVGIGIYGFANDPLYTSKLKNVCRFISSISQIYYVNKGETIGYNRGYTAYKKQKIAAIPVGHADGISRLLGNGKGHVNIKGQKATIVGNICMDLFMVDATEIPCKVGDSVIIFDKQKTVESIAKTCQTIPYEIITLISSRVNRKLV